MSPVPSEEATDGDVVSTEHHPPSDLIVPIYLDTQALLDLLASLEDGFSLVERVTTRNLTGETAEKSVNAEFGVANILNLLKIGAGASRSSRQDEQAGEERLRERYHTYGSLLHKLRSILVESGRLRHDGRESLSSGDFVEVQGVFAPNPLLGSLITVERLFSIAMLFDESTLEPTARPGGGKRPSKARAKQGPSEADQFRTFLQSLRADLEQGDIRTLVVETTDGSGYRVVTSIFVEYLRDSTMTELAYREFQLLGKIVRHLPSSSESIDLLRGTALGGVAEDKLAELLEGFENAQMAGLNLPVIDTRVDGPAFEILPIAIFV